ncbi:Transcriptional regulator, xre family [Pediococcus damnosus]|uniref:Transcriptional regulator, xre family n=1 Tax=Pediococcus damnosus TaxID=51663 RepID=A0A0R2HL28_9LACO|nr:helix-turn-helix domain-containing protein [Pediococcus damnosus]AMV63065.1 Transcriptional regulator, xre family [Pediococcus damnosus]AMV64781.1 Transcriptional regulator, xre family [Pediococcus damnosus]AMV67045.1 Transcriptional regulator, xre family [Pediococcus damnosus]KJU74389.1 pirin [Pediococcus damnosus LMG 28219]KRN53689.1 XRE family transcriptional regulator [Pediococcus damnosus]
MLHRENEIKKYHTTSAADLIRETMNYYKITQTDLADRLGVSQKHISEILQKKRFINETLALRIEAVMGISSILLLNLDSNFKLRLAKETPVQDMKNKSDKFLKRYDWVTV